MGLCRTSLTKRFGTGRNAKPAAHIVSWIYEQRFKVRRKKDFQNSKMTREAECQFGTSRAPKGATLLGLGDKLIAKSADRNQVLRLGGIVFNVAAQADNEIINRARIGIFLQVPDLFQNFFARYGTPAIADEIAEQICFHQRELENVLAVVQLQFLVIDCLAGKAELV